MGDGVPVKKRWKIDFSSMCSKNVVSFSRATAGASPNKETTGASSDSQNLSRSWSEDTREVTQEQGTEEDIIMEQQAEGSIQEDEKSNDERNNEPEIAEKMHECEKTHEESEIRDSKVEMWMSHESDQAMGSAVEEKTKVEMWGALNKKETGNESKKAKEESETTIELWQVQEVKEEEEPKTKVEMWTAQEEMPGEINDRENDDEEKVVLSSKGKKKKAEPEAGRKSVSPIAVVVEPEVQTDSQAISTSALMADLDLDDPSSPPIVVSKPKAPKVVRKKKVMIIQTYNSASEEEEPEIKVRPQRRSKPSMMDLRDQHRIFNTTSFVKERNAGSDDAYEPESRPEVVAPPPVPQPCPPPAPEPSPPKEETRVPTSSSDDTEDGLPLSQFVPKRPSTPEKERLLKKVKKRKLKKKKKDSQEPQKPVSAYALFFRDMQSSIKAERPDASFGEISKIVANQWDALEDPRKTDYKRKTENAKKDYLKRLASFKANKISTELFPDVSEPPEVSPPPPVSAAAATPTFAPADKAVGGHLYSSQQSQAQDFSVREAPSAGDYQPTVLPTKPGICVNDGCTNLAIEDQRWDREYCSTECVVQHCRDAFQSWVLQRQDCSSDHATAIY